MEISNGGATSYTTDPFLIALNQTNSYLYPDMEYKLTDLLGSTRMSNKLNFTFAGVYQNATIQYLVDPKDADIYRQYNYAFEKIAREYINPGTIAEKYQYTGKERDTESGYDYFNARNYHSDVGRFLSVDPLASKYPGWSGYHYSADNPINVTDPTGMEWSENNKELATRFGTICPDCPDEDAYDEARNSVDYYYYDQETKFAIREQSIPEVESTAKQEVGLRVINYVPLLGSFNSYWENMNEKDYWGAAVDLVMFGLELYTFGSASELIIANRFASTAAKTGGSWAKTSGILRDALKGKGNYGLGSGTAEEAMQAGKAWVGEGFEMSSNGRFMISKDGLRQFQPANFKPKLGIEQANFYWKNLGQKTWQSNGQLDIIKP